jgi:hypothetical protein
MNQKNYGEDILYITSFNLAARKASRASTFSNTFEHLPENSLQNVPRTHPGG